MAPIKFEENIREKLQDRELQPSKEAWNKLAATLEDEPQKKNNRILWMAVAASFMGVLFVVSFLISTKNDTTTNQIVEEDNMNPPVEETLVNDPKIENPIIENPTESIAGADKLKEESLSEKENIRKNNTSQIVATTKNKEKQFVDKKNVNSEEIETSFKEKVTNEVVATNSKKVENSIKEGTLKTKEELFIDNKVNEVITAIEQIQKDNNTVTAKDIDALLTKAQRDISNNKILNSGNRKVDATALLLNVESELERSFRDKVFEALGNGFNKIRTAVVERNN